MSKRAAEIAQATQELIVESGGSLPTVRQIAARSFLSPAAIYVHFPNFEAIVEDVRSSALESLGKSVSGANPRTIGEAVGPAARWMVDNPALLVACTTPAASGISQGCIGFVRESLGRIGVSVDDHIVALAFRLVAPVASLIVDHGFGPTEVEKYLQSLSAPIGVVESLPPVEVIRA